MFYNLKCLYLVSCQTLLPFVYSSFDLNVCVIDSLGNMWISCLCLYSSADLSLQNQSELVLRDSPQFSYIRSLCLTVLHLHCEFLVTPCVDPFCRKPLLNTRRYLWCFEPLECPDFHHTVHWTVWQFLSIWVVIVADWSCVSRSVVYKIKKNSSILT